MGCTRREKRNSPRTISANKTYPDRGAEGGMDREMWINNQSGAIMKPCAVLRQEHAMEETALIELCLYVVGV